MEKICCNSQCFQEKNYKPKLLTRLILKKIIMKGKNFEKKIIIKGKKKPCRETL
jgi:hypothetical protein